MNKKDIKTIAKILLIGGILLCVFAQIVPWGELTTQGYKTTHYYYSWGVQAPELENYTISIQWIFYLSVFGDMELTNIIFNSDDYKKYIVPLALSQLIFPLSLLAIITGCYEYIKKKEKTSIAYEAGFLSATSIVFFYILIQFGIIPSFIGTPSIYQYSFGFYMIFISSILFFLSYFVSKYIKNYVHDEIISEGKIDNNKNLNETD